MTDTIRITCQTCHGSGVTTLRHVSGDPQLEAIGECPEEKCRDGRIEMTDEEVEELVLASSFALLTAASVTGITAGAERRLHRALIPAGVAS